MSSLFSRVVIHERVSGKGRKVEFILKNRDSSVSFDMEEDGVRHLRTIGGPSRIRREHHHLTDIIHVSLIPHKIKASKIADFYINDKLSASQIAKKIGCSKTVVLEKLRSLGIRNGLVDGKKLTSDYKTSNPPFGFMFQNGQMVTNPSEVKVCRFVVQLLKKENTSYREVARRIEVKGLKNRNGKNKWGHSLIKKIYEKWGDRF